MRGRWKKSRAKATRCFWPGESSFCQSLTSSNFGRTTTPRSTNSSWARPSATTCLHVLVCSAVGLYLLATLRVDHYVSQSAHGHKDILRHEVQIQISGLGDLPLHQRPQPTEHSKQARLAAAVGTGDEHALAGLDGEVQILHQESAVGLVNRDV
eukprot:CAMPEP_0177285332 /NCGR_PEP_ID=MMETSP0367-20130122/73013_1 /TAXON_ID=447022 ORGANISM="Scrippsiella hangoei-like, Strain SHHI-4" /NCGR_SAMPLE_ID=MMETSP0367 /ASSEMBLY_ACC=CAM_ASM_000362 /LENGTH=153 /DNA_ID=CAMNT_0018742465 /DNA_START=285 /DNA_END=743 /DNA_ORIENTATION=+